MSIFKVATVVIYVTSVLTSTVNGSPTPDENSSPSSSLKSFFGSPNPSDDSETAPGEPLNIISEGGSMIGGSAITSKASTKLKSSIKPAVEPKDTSPPAENLASTSAPDAVVRPSQIKARKGAENERKTFARKGVDVTSEITTDTSKSDEVEAPKNAADEAKTSTVKPVLRTEATEPLIEKNGTTNNTKASEDGDTRVPYILVPGQRNNTMIHRPKPTVTSGEGNDDGEGMPSSATQTEFGMPKKVDYVIPVVITIMAAPVLGIAAYILYTRGRDCWDKRHYRRMDFLIDGMYND